MSPRIESAESQWLAQLATMREAIAELKLDTPNTGGPSYGDDLIIDDNDLTGGSGSDEIFDISDEDYDGYSSDYAEETLDITGNDNLNGIDRGNGWLKLRTGSLANQRSGLEANDLNEQIIALLASDFNGSSGQNMRWAPTD